MFFGGGGDFQTFEIDKWFTYLTFTLFGTLGKNVFGIWGQKFEGGAFIEKWGHYENVDVLDFFWRFLESTVQENEGPHRLTRDGDGEQRFENVLVQERNKSLNVPDDHCLTHVTCFNFTSFGGWFQFFSKNISCSVHHSHFYEPVDYY